MQYISFAALSKNLRALTLEFFVRSQAADFPKESDNYFLKHALQENFDVDVDVDIEEGIGIPIYLLSQPF